MNHSIRLGPGFAPALPGSTEAVLAGAAVSASVKLALRKGPSVPSVLPHPCQPPQPQGKQQDSVCRYRDCEDPEAHAWPGFDSRDSLHREDRGVSHQPAQPCMRPISPSATQTLSPSSLPTNATPRRQAPCPSNTEGTRNQRGSDP